MQVSKKCTVHECDDDISSEPCCTEAPGDDVWSYCDRTW